MGWQIVRHSFGLVFRNWREALRVSLGPLLILYALSLAILLQGVSALMAEAQATGVEPNALLLFTGPFALRLLLVLGASLICGAWIAVGWHRFVLLEDRPGLLPGFRSRSIGLYVAWLLGLTALYVVVGVAVGLLLALVSYLTRGAGAASLVILLPLLAVMVLLLLQAWHRLCILLPAAALGRPLRLGEAWALTAPADRMIWGVTLSLLALLVAHQLAMALLQGILPYALMLPIGLVTGWIALMVPLSVMTTLYGNLVERRRLAA